MLIALLYTSHGCLLVYKSLHFISLIFFSNEVLAHEESVIQPKVKSRMPAIELRALDFAVERFFVGIRMLFMILDSGAFIAE